MDDWFGELLNASSSKRPAESMQPAEGPCPKADISPCLSPAVSEDSGDAVAALLSELGETFDSEPMCHVVELAAAEVSENPQASEALREFAAVRPNDAEQRGHDVLVKHELSCPVEINKVDLSDTKRFKNWPYIKFSTWVKYLLDSGRLAQQLCACADLQSMQVKLQEFWLRYEAIDPEHQIFAMRDAGTVDLKWVIPVYSHSDEGRGHKKQAFWLLSTHGALGRGTRAFLKKSKDKLPLKRNGFGLNFCGHTWTTNFLFSCMLRKFFKKDPEILHSLVGVYARDMEDLLLNGVSSTDGLIQVRCCHLGTKGDLPALAKLGRMNHTFGNVPKKAASKKPCEGICWMCCAGRESNPSQNISAIPFEDTSGKPLWEGTLGQQDACDGMPAILEGVPLLEENRWQFFKTDLWHNFHLGVAKHYVASALVSILENVDLE
ncbi:unnamed protein product, partial [Cladocopium goreaui]